MRPGERQSPIDLAAAPLDLATRLPELGFRYARETTLLSLEITPAGCPGDPYGTVLVTPESGAGRVVLESVSYDLLQFHWHWPAEHELGAEPFPLEMHLVHQRDGAAGLDNMLVVAVWLEARAAHGEIERIFGALPEPGETGIFGGSLHHFDLTTLLPPIRTSYRYAGSLTTPSEPGQEVFPETVDWVVLSDTLNVSEAQLDAFRRHFPNENRRACQPLNGREVRCDRPPAGDEPS